MSLSLLRIGASALIATQRAVETAGHNVANATTDGYTRQRVNTTTAPPTPGTPGLDGGGERGGGVVVVSVDRLRDGLADLAFRAQAGAAGSWAAQAQVLDQAQQVLGPFGAGLPAAVSEFWAAWDQLSLAPADIASRQAVLDAGTTVAQWLRDASASLGRLAADSASRLAEGAVEVTRLAAEVASLNQDIATAVSGGQAPNDLLDRRDALVDQIATLTGATVRESDLGMVDVYVGGIALVRGHRSETVQASATALTVAGTPLPSGGRLGAYSGLVTTTLPSLAADLDALATGLRDTVNAAHAAGVDLDGATGNAFFAGATAATISLAPGLTPRDVAASAGGSAYDGNHALVMARLRAVPATGGQPFGDAVNALLGRLGGLAADAASRAGAATATVEHARLSRAAANGVSVNDEMVDLVRFQRAYEAAARVVTAADEMLDRIVNGLGLVGR